MSSTASGSQLELPPSAAAREILILIITFHSPRRPQLRRRFGKLSVRTEENRDLKRTVKHVNSERTVTPLMIQYIISDK
ncbi:hypothetical protein F2P81_022884 [Scophthalmus maximus]|uniref:Uncharacterized protein n=1 Tax=Scophthalmus maximus TaxID=52904 RepID=A0A6A4RY67_SCOMX|nr:hypothetical protein F2P81_022884 [Scophthalmus maximus]